MKFYRDLFVKYAVPVTEKIVHHAIETGKTVLGVAATAAGLAVLGGAVYGVAAVAEWSIIAKVILFVPAALGLLFAVMSMATAFARDDYSSKARLQGCTLAGAFCVGFMCMLTAGMFSVAVPAAALALFCVFQLVTGFDYLEPMPLNRILPVALGGDTPVAAG